MLVEDAKEILLKNIQTFTPEIQKATKTILEELENLQKKLADVTGESKNLIGEIWKDIPDYEGIYRINNFGEIEKHYPTGWRPMRAKQEKNGYILIGLSKDKKRRWYGVHVLVASAFIPNTENKSTVDHIDGNRANNNVENLRWATRKEQIAYAMQRGTKKTGVMHPMAKLRNEDDIRYIRKNYKRYSKDNVSGSAALAKKFNMSQSDIRLVAKGVYFKNVKD